MIWTDPDEGNDQTQHYCDRWPVLLMPSARQRQGQIAHWTGGELVRRLRTVQPLARKLDAPGWLPVRMLPGSTHRKADQIAAVWALVLDLDQDVESIESLWQSVRAQQLEAMAHTTYSHTLQTPKARVVFPFSEECPADRWAEVWAAGQRWASTWGATLDTACRDPSRLYFLPAAPVERLGAFAARYWTGEALSWRKLLCEHPAPRQRKRIAAPRRTHAGLPQRHLSREERYAEAALQGILRDLSSSTGARNDAIWRAGCKLGRLLVRCQSLQRATVEAELEAAALQLYAGEAGRAGEAVRTARRAIAEGLEER